MTLEVLYHDNQMLAVNKPADLLTQPKGRRLAFEEGLAEEAASQRVVA